MPSSIINDMNKTEAGFHLLVMLSLADGSTQPVEANIILEFLNREYALPLDLNKEQEFIKMMPEEEIHTHFSEVCSRFYSLSNKEERRNLVDFAMQIVMSDRKRNETEDMLINVLLHSWDLIRPIAV